MAFTYFVAVYLLQLASNSPAIVSLLWTGASGGHQIRMLLQKHPCSETSVIHTTNPHSESLRFLFRISKCQFTTGNVSDVYPFNLWGIEQAAVNLAEILELLAMNTTGSVTTDIGTFSWPHF